MKKQVALFTGILILLISMVSAYSYNSASLGEALDAIGGENIGLTIVFLVSFALILVILNRTGFFKENNAALSVISLMLALGITYFGVYKTGINLDVSGMFYNLGFSDMGLDLLVFFGVLIFGFLLIWKLKSGALLVIGIAILSAYLLLKLSLEVGIIGGALIIGWILFKYVIFRTKNTVYGMKNKYNFNAKFYNKK
jgi:hypothetical protein